MHVHVLTNPRFFCFNKNFHPFITTYNKWYTFHSIIPQKKRIKKKWASSHTPTPPLLDNTIHNEWQPEYALNTHHFDMVPWLDAVDSLSESDDKTFLFFFSPDWGFLTGLLNCTISSIKSESSSDLIVMKVEKIWAFVFHYFADIMIQYLLNTFEKIS